MLINLIFNLLWRVVHYDGAQFGVTWAHFLTQTSQTGYKFWEKQWRLRVFEFGSHIAAHSEKIILINRAWHEASQLAVKAKRLWQNSAERWSTLDGSVSDQANVRRVIESKYAFNLIESYLTLNLFDKGIEVRILACEKFKIKPELVS